MRIIFFNGKVLDCSKVEFCQLKPGFVLIDESTLIEIGDIMKIVSGRYCKVALASVYGKTCQEGK